MAWSRTGSTRANGRVEREGGATARGSVDGDLRWVNVRCRGGAQEPMQRMAVRDRPGPCHPGVGPGKGDVTQCADGRTTGSGAVRGPAWWSDALNDPWRNPETDAVIMTGTQWAEPPAGRSRHLAGTGGPRARAGRHGGGHGRACWPAPSVARSATSRPPSSAVRPSTLGPPVAAPPPLRTSDSLPALVAAGHAERGDGAGHDRATATSLGSGFVITAGRLHPDQRARGLGDRRRARSG